MGDPTPLPVKVVTFSAELWTYLDKAEDAYRLAAFAAMSSVFVVIALLTGLLLAAALRRNA